MSKAVSIIDALKRRPLIRSSLARLRRFEPLLRLEWRLKGLHEDHLQGDRATRFSRIYEQNIWTDEQGLSRSGPGSTLAATSSIRKQLPEFLKRVEARSLLDIGCGDFNWMSTIDLPCPYIGIDVVPSVIAEVAAQYGNSDRTFLVIDACAEPLPVADIILCREVLFHLSFIDLERLMSGLKATGARYLLATSNANVETNQDILTGAYSDRNLERPPFELGRPTETLEDGDWLKGRYLGVWKLQ